MSVTLNYSGLYIYVCVCVCMCIYNIYIYVGLQMGKKKLRPVDALSAGLRKLGQKKKYIYNNSGRFLNQQTKN